MEETEGSDDVLLSFDLDFLMSLRIWRRESPMRLQLEALPARGYS